MSRYAALAALVPLVAAHGFIRTPAPRQPGDAYKAACGDQPFYQQSSDINGNVQGIMQVVGNNLDASACNLWLCKGFQFDDNKANVHSFSLGETIDFDVNIAAPHTGIANVSVVKTSSNSIIGTPLIEFDNYAANAGVAANNTAFSVTLPADLEGECTTAGDCVLQWFWDAADINQTYESCVDFTVSGSGSGNTPSKPQTPASSAASQAPVTSATPAPAPAPTSADEVVTTAISPAPSATPSKPEEPADDDECPADEEDDDEEGDDEDDECPADEDESGDETVENPTEPEDDECPADEEDDDEDDECPADEDDEEGDYPEGGNGAPAPAPTLSNKDVEPTNKPQPTQPKPSNKPAGPNTTLSTVIREVTITKEAPTVTVTAPAVGECTTA